MTTTSSKLFTNQKMRIDVCRRWLEGDRIWNIAKDYKIDGMVITEILKKEFGVDSHGKFIRPPIQRLKRGISLSQHFMHLTQFHLRQMQKERPKPFKHEGVKQYLHRTKLLEFYSKKFKTQKAWEKFHFEKAMYALTDALAIQEQLQSKTVMEILGWKNIKLLKRLYP